MIKPLVSSEWLQKNMDRTDLIILDASPLNNASGKQSKYKDQVIPGAKYFDLKQVFSDPNGTFPNTFPTIEQFEQGCRAIGINNSSTLVIYDNLGIYTSPRARWMFKVMGHKNVTVLNGGLPDWIKRGFETQTNHKVGFDKSNFTCQFDSKQLVDIKFIESNLLSQKQLIIDARSAGRFNGVIEEPRKGLRSGHIQDSINIPFESVLEDGRYKSEAELIEVFQKSGVDERPLTFSCGSGITACIVLLAAQMVLENKTSVYDGSWTEWATLK